jgi:hypothetical protein
MFRGLAVSLEPSDGGDENSVDWLIGFVEELAGFGGGSDFAAALHLLAGVGCAGVSFEKISSGGTSLEEPVTNRLLVAAGLVTRVAFCTTFGYVFCAAVGVGAEGVGAAASEALEGFSSSAAASEA